MKIMVLDIVSRKNSEMPSLRNSNPGDQVFYRHPEGG